MLPNGKTLENDLHGCPVGFAAWPDLDMGKNTEKYGNTWTNIGNIWERMEKYGKHMVNTSNVWETYGNLAMVSWKRIYDGPRGSRVKSGDRTPMETKGINGIDVSETS